MLDLLLSSLREAFAPPTWSTWALVILGIVAFYFSRRTLITLIDQTRAAKDAATAAKDAAHTASLNAQAVINSERAWIVPQMSVTSVASASVLVFENQGRTPAEITYIAAYDAFPPMQKGLPEIPSYGEDAEFAQKRVLGPGKNWEYQTTDLGVVVPADLLAEINTNKKRFFHYGIVKYKDVLTGAPHETRFCYFFSPPLAQFLAGGPPEYTRYT